MIIYETKFIQASPIPKQIDFLAAADRRELSKTEKERRLYRNLRAGAAGEQFVLELLEKYGQKHWVVLSNLWLDFFGVFESDLVVLTRNRPYVFEVKNFEGRFEYKESRCFVNGRQLKENCIQQAEKALLNLQDICAGMDRSLAPKGALLMVGEHNDVRIESPVKGIEVKTRAQLKRYIQEIVRLEESEYRKQLDVPRLLDRFEQLATLNPFGPHASYSPEDVLAKGRRGIYCQSCGSYLVETRRKFVQCACGALELRRAAILRTIHEFGLLTFEHDFMTRRDLEVFMGEQVSKDLLLDVLNTHFVRNQSGKYANYVNKKALFNK